MTLTITTGNNTMKIVDGSVISIFLRDINTKRYSGANKLQILSDSKQNFAKYTIEFSKYSVVKFNTVPIATIAILETTINIWLNESPSVVLVDSEGNFIEDSVTSAIKIIPYPHAEIHEGTHYAHKKSHSLAKNATVDHLIITPNTTKWAHVILGIGTLVSNITVTLYKDATASNNGTPEPVFNRNHNILDNNTTTIFSAPTISDVGNLVYTEIIGTEEKKIGGQAREDDEIVFKQNSKYLLRITENNVNATILSILIDWYEHTNK